ncbi:MAG: RraA family protein [Acidobacteriota bacterium]|nr:RraA family protein [Acidobacteriota bacterium]
MQNNLSALKAAGTAAIADVFDSLQRTPPVLDNCLRPVGPAAVFAGPAYTITGESARFTGGDREKLAAIDNMPQGVVAVWASRCAKGVCCFGDLLASAMRARGVAAAVVDGGVRDTAFLAEMGMPVVARYRTPAQGVGRWRVTASQGKVWVRGALEEWLSVAPGDIVVGDSDGQIVIPEALLEEVTAKVIEWSRIESGARAEIIAGMPLLTALEKYGHL